ncbi:MAG: endonuclease MutS2 [Thermodesulfobacteriota bacterium]
MDSATLDVLEFNDVLEALADFVHTARGSELVYAIRPVDDRDFIEEAFERFTEAAAYGEASGSFPLAGVSDIRPVLMRPFPEGAFIPGEELLLLRDNLVAAGRLKALANAAFLKKYPALSPLFLGLSESRPLLDKLIGTIDDKGLILDGASSTLRGIRGKLRSSKTRIRELLSSLIQDPDSKEAIQDDIITIRDDRFVLSVVAGKHSEIPGVIHGRSGSGATFFVEPMELVALNNSLSILKKQELAEELRILKEITELVLLSSEELLGDLELMAGLDVIAAKVAFAKKTGALVPAIGAGGEIRFSGARHPLLVLKELGGGPSVIPVDIRVGPKTRVVVISGANTGGKTVALKTLGLLTLMASSGLPVTAGAGSRAVIFDSVFADVGDRQDIGASLSTFSAHIRRITLFLKEAGPSSLVLIDEIGAGTDPSEAEALGLAVLERLKKAGALSVVTTHLNLIKAHGAVNPAYENVSVEFDEATLEPRYRLIYGVPGPSLGVNIAGALGLPEELINEARSYIKGGEGAFVESIRAIEAEKDRLRTTNESLALLNTRRQAELTRLRESRDTLVKGAKKRIKSIVEEARSEVARMRRDYEEALREAKKAGGAGSTGRPKVNRGASASITKAGEKYLGKFAGRQKAPLNSRLPFEGERVRLAGGKTKGLVTRVDEGARRAELLMGSVKVWVDIKKLELSGFKEKKEKSYAHVELKTDSGGSGAGAGGAERGAGARLKIIGLRRDEALAELTRFIDNAHLQGLNVVEVIHGMGTGALKAAVAEHLSERPEVKSFGPGPPEGGGAGVTVVYLK